MKEQDFILKKYVRARSASEALDKDASTPVCEVFLTTDKPSDSNVQAVGFTHYPADDGVPYEARRKR